MTTERIETDQPIPSVAYHTLMGMSQEEQLQVLEKAYGRTINRNGKDGYGPLIDVADLYVDSVMVVSPREYDHDTKLWKNFFGFVQYPGIWYVTYTKTFLEAWIQTAMAMVCVRQGI